MAKKKTTNGKDPLARSRAEAGSQADFIKGRKDMPCTDCDRLVPDVDANAVRVWCSHCIVKRTAPPEKNERQTVQRPSDTTVRRGRVSQYAGKFLYRLRKKNPRRAGTHSHAIWNKMRDGMTYDAYIEIGGKNVDLQYEVKHGRIAARATLKQKAG